MPQQSWSDKLERQYDHIKEGLRERGEPESTAKEIAARTVNKDRARSGAAETASRTSLEGTSHPNEEAACARTRVPGGRTKDQLYNEAKHKGVRGRSKMTKAELERAVGR